VDELEEPGRERRELPRTARGLRTRAALIAAARTVFERDGYVAARLVDITAEAGCATGSFYTYFAGKKEIFAAVLEAAQEEMLHPQMAPLGDRDDPVAVIEAANRAYLDAYRRNAKLMELLEQVAAVDDDIRAFRRRRNALFTGRNARAIAELQRRGIADPELDPEIAATALSSMVGRTAAAVYVSGEIKAGGDLAATLTRLWVNALAIRPAPGEQRPAADDRHRPPAKRTSASS